MFLFFFFLMLEYQFERFRNCHKNTVLPRKVLFFLPVALLIAQKNLFVLPFKHFHTSYSE